MKIKELCETTAGAVATVAAPVGGMISRQMKNPDGTAKNALDVDTNIMGGKSKKKKAKSSKDKQYSNYYWSIIMTEKATKESGLQRHIGIKKYGKKGFEELQKAGREGASEEEKGAIKDKHLPKKKTNEGLADLADMAERDHEVQMARSDLYKIAKYAIKLHEMMKNVSEAEGIEGWQQAKITKAADYLGSVYHALDYDTKFESVQVPEDAKPKQHKRVLSDSEIKSYKGSLAMKMSEITEAKGLCPDCGKPSYTTLPEEKQKGVDGKVCWKGYKRMGTKKKGGKTVDNCVKM